MTFPGDDNNVEKQKTSRAAAEEGGRDGPPPSGSRGTSSGVTAFSYSPWKQSDSQKTHRPAEGRRQPFRAHHQSPPGLERVRHVGQDAPGIHAPLPGSFHDGVVKRGIEIAGLCGREDRSAHPCPTMVPVMLLTDGSAGIQFNR